ncbi:MAG: IPT/TIG domain-containing protein, partial [Myxococcales bacterium]|nr:IPT/TIG domain-containing protein [Myxococcales bacterium]
MRRPFTEKGLPGWCALFALGLPAAVSSCEPTPSGDGVASGDVYSPPRGVPSPDAAQASPPPISVGFPPTHPIASIGPDIGQDPTDKAEPPSLTSITPEFGAATGGEVVVVRGANFVDGAVVMFGDRPSPNTFFIDDSWLNVTTPVGDPGLVDLRVVNPDGQEAVLLAAFRFDAALTLSSAEPTSGATDGGTVVTLRGTGFSAGVVAVFGDRMAPVTEVVSGTELRVTTPPGPRGGVDVRVVFDDGGSAVLGDAFEYASPAVVDDVAPRVGLTAGGDPVVLTGRHLTPDTRVDFGNAPASVTAVAVDGTWIEVRTPPNAPGLASLVVDNGAGITVVPGAFVYRGAEAQPLTLWAVHPGSGPLKGGNTVSLLATGLGNGEITTVRIGGVLATQVTVDAEAHEVRAVVPAATTLGPASVELRQTVTWTSLPSAYLYADTMVATTLSPDSGNEAGGDVVTIAGAGFDGVDPVQVTFGGLAASDVHVASDHQLVVVAPPCSPGHVEVTVARGDDVVRVPGGWFCRASAIRLLAVDPPEVAQSGGALVRVIGTGLPDDATISLGGKLVAAEWDSQNAVYVRALASEPGSYDVGLSSASLGSARSLPRALRVFDPENRLAAISGPPLLRNLNVTIIDGGTGAALPGATAILGADPTTALQCLTDGRGQCTIGARELRGPQTITAAREGFSAYTVAGFDARDVTLFIRQLAAPGQAAPPGEPGAGGDGQLDVNTLLGTISGKVVGLGKYVQLPAPSCDVIGSPDGQQCTPCGVSADCAPGLTCTTLEGSGSYCLKSCGSQADCSAGYQCGTLGTASCVPSGDEPTVRCETTRRSLFGSNPDPGPGANVDIAAGEYEIDARLGDVVVFCVASYVAPSGVTIPVAMGISETVVVHLGDV